MPKGQYAIKQVYKSDMEF